MYGSLKEELIERYKHFVKHNNNDYEYKTVWGIGAGLQDFDMIIAIFSRIPDYEINTKFYSYERNKKDFNRIQRRRKPIKISLIILVASLLLAVIYFP